MTCINQNIKIDFPVPQTLQTLIAEAEEADGRDEGRYFRIAETIDVCAKEACVNGLLTQRQWDILTERYPQ